MLDGRWLDIAALPVAAAIVECRVGRGRTIVGLLAVAHLVILANVALFPIPIDPGILAVARVEATAPLGNGGLHLVPFVTIGPVLAGDANPIATWIAILNAFVLTPAGIYLPLLFQSMRGWRALAPLAIVGGASVEAAQPAISSVLGFNYRTIDIDDVILNACGIVVGWLAVRFAFTVRARAEQQGSGTAHAR